MHDFKDGGYKSRKLNYAIGTSAAIIGVVLIASKVPTLVPMVDAAIGGLMGTLALYIGANVGNKWTVGKTSPVKPAEPAEESPK